MEIKLILLDNNRHGSNDDMMINDESSNKHIMIIKPEQSLMIPLNACGFEQVQMRPFLNKND